ncbi:MAG: hypothetical protein CL388_00560 [Acidiferrobacteraceae bacterium]|jgi:hypothetical protein|nr:hypothetical protein [Acidiferrobacteraceae bacterium]MDP6725224.1 hypothetical protein [Arenicellales bacterium]|tara:strand:- start:950 stop:2905 length:1956 start_codon:yes stop_codon:yes gene_type:complete
MSEIELFISAAVLYAVYLLLPGYLFCVVAGVHRNRFLLTYGISFSILILIQIPVRAYGGSMSEWYVWLHGSIAILLGVGVVVGRWQQIGFLKKRPQMKPTVGFVVVLVLIALHLLIVGPYTEIPSDIYVHLGRVKEVSSDICHGKMYYLPIENLITMDNMHYYTIPFLHAAVACELGVRPLTLVPAATLVTSLIFLGVVYWFALRVVAAARLSIFAKTVAAALTVFFTLLWFGVNTFSFVRYYSYFPVIFSFSLLFVVLALSLDYLERPQQGLLQQLPTLLMLLVMMLVLRVVHMQEMLFALILISGIACWRMVRSFRCSGGLPQPLIWQARVQGLLAVVVVLLTFFIAISYRSHLLPFGRYISSLRIGNLMFYPHIIELGDLIPIVRNLPISNPAHHFWDTLTLFGLIVYLWYFFRYRWFAKMDYLVVAMASPLITLFNPLFIYWILHLTPYYLVWRMSYLMPLALAGAFLVVFSFSRASQQKSWQQWVISSILLLVLMGALLPFDSPLIYNYNSRVWSLLNVDKVAGAGLWGDLVEAVDSVDGSRVIFADGATRYLLGSSTRHFEPTRVGYKFNLQNRNALLDNRGALLVVNRRDGVQTWSATLSKHWRSDVLKVSKRYPKALDKFITKHPDNFKLLWSNDGIWLYEIF